MRSAALRRGSPGIPRVSGSAAAASGLTHELQEYVKTFIMIHLLMGMAQERHADPDGPAASGQYPAAEQGL